MTESRVLPQHADEFARWQQQMDTTVGAFPGFLDRRVIPPSPPLQPDWVVVQRFSNAQAAQNWLSSKERQQALKTIAPWLVGADNIQLIEDEAAPESTAVSIVVTTTIKPGQEETFRAWNQRINAAQAQFPGFQGFKISPPIPGVQDAWVTVLQFDNEEHLNAWLNSPQRKALLAEMPTFASGSETRTVRTGFEQWFRFDGAAAHSPAWKQNMLVLSGLYPVVFLFGFFVQTPLLMKAWSFPFWLALFCGNVFGVTVLNWLVPWISKRFAWWLQPAGTESQRQTLIGVAAVLVIYLACMLIFSRFPPAL